MNPAELLVSTSSDTFEPLSTSMLMYGATSAHPPEVATRPNDTHLRAKNSAARHMPPSHCISDAQASFSEQPAYAAALPTMAKVQSDCVEFQNELPKDCVFLAAGSQSFI